MMVLFRRGRSRLTRDTLACSTRRSGRHARRPGLDVLEAREFLSANAVAGPQIHTADSLDRAIVSAHADHAGTHSTARRHRIDRSNQAASVTYYSDAPAVNLPPGESVSAWQGLRASSTPGQYLIVGTVNGNTTVGQALGSGILFEGTIDGKTGTNYAVNIPGARYTSVFGPDNLGNGVVALVGNDRNLPDPRQQVQTSGFLFEGTPAQLGDASHYTTVNYQPNTYNYDTIHSIMGGLAVGNAVRVSVGTTPRTFATVAFIYDVATKGYTPISYPGSTANTAYGIWYNGGTSYTICGGYKTRSDNLPAPDLSFPFGTAYMVDYNAATGAFSNWKSFPYPGTPGVVYRSHFEGISALGNGTYSLNGDWASRGKSGRGAAFVVVGRNPDGSFTNGRWLPLDNTSLRGVTSSNAVAGNAVVGIVYHGVTSKPYQATVNLST